MNKKVKSNDGFTLIEVLVALSLLMISFSLLTTVTIDSVKQFQHLQSKIQAHCVAKELLSKIQLKEISRTTLTGQPLELDFFHQHWVSNIQIQKTAHSRIKKVAIQISHTNESAPLSSLTGFIAE